MSRGYQKWQPLAGQDAIHVVRSRGRRPGLTRRVTVLAEASGQRMVVAAIGRKGIPVRLTVKTENLHPPQEDLFSG